MPTIEASIEIAAPGHVVFDLAQDYALRLDWDPFVRELRFQDGATKLAAGVLVWVKAKNGLTMTVEYLTVDRPRRVAVKMVSTSLLFRALRRHLALRTARPRAYARALPLRLRDAMGLAPDAS